MSGAKSTRSEPTGSEPMRQGRREFIGRAAGAPRAAEELARLDVVVRRDDR